MQTFLPYQNIIKSVQCLDKRRICKQRIEATQILNIILNKTETKGWRKHPCVRQWIGFENCLIYYRNECIIEWTKRKNKDGSFCKNNMPLWKISGDIIYPDWFGYEEFHSCHRATLLYKDYEWYSQFGWTEEPKYEYWWPSKNSKEILI